jgi:hypothetical protein
VASLYSVKMHLLAGWAHLVLLHTPKAQRSLKVPVLPSSQGVPLGLFTILVQAPGGTHKTQSGGTTLPGTGKE